MTRSTQRMNFTTERLKIYDDKFLLDVVKKEMTDCNDDFHHRENNSLYKGDLPPRSVAIKSFEIHKTNSINIKKIVKIFDKLFIDDA
jgi:hypothetical protein